MKILITAFDPFGGEATNPALEAIRSLPDALAGIELITLEVPTIFGKSIQLVTETLQQLKPEAVLAVGQAGGRSSLTLERVAINLNDAIQPDNAGQIPVEQPVVVDGPAAYFSTLPFKAMALALCAAGIPAQVSNSAGTFVCNHLMYGLLHFAATSMPGLKVGFMHVPYIPAQTAAKPSMPSMALTDIVRGLQLCLQTIARPDSAEGTVGSELATGSLH
ncbi:MAG: pyroglutamyl-peptidase I [Spirochaetes bacterium]|nr:pyroglutamyl-peptidase I [Spirochaetota bacterium]MBU0956143.1 pyroglutamyl-peptidase I [Spirochaetota bacterium]